MSADKNRVKKNNQSLHHDSGRWPRCMGCQRCSDLDVCGGLAIKRKVFDCMEFCNCEDEDKPNCELACPLNPPKFVSRFREVGGWSLQIENGPRLKLPQLPEFVPLIKDGACRLVQFQGDAVALRLDRLFNHNNGLLKFDSRRQLNTRYKIGPKISLLINAIGFDEGLERYWDRGRKADLLSQIRALEPALMTSPNFSLFTDVPRHENLYNMRRIVMCWHEIVTAGIPCALHLNARTDHDWKRWAEFLRVHDEVEIVACEFTSGNRGRRGRWYSKKLVELAQEIDRPLCLVIRGGTRYLSRLSTAFDRLIFVHAKPYVATMNRQRFTWENDGHPLSWETVLMPQNEPLDELFAHNVCVASRMVRDRIAGKVA